MDWLSKQRQCVNIQGFGPLVVDHVVYIWPSEPMQQSCALATMLLANRNDGQLE